ncbi:MAG: acyl-CoA dehydrogenase family protein, partial [Bermanella sp.]
MPANYTQLNFGLGETNDMLVEQVTQFVDKEVAPIAAEVDKENDFPYHLWAKFGDMGLSGITVSEEYGGTDMGYLAHVLVMEQLSRGSAAIGLSYAAHSNLCVNQINRNGSDAQKRKYLPSLVAGEKVGALAISEPNAGSDAVSITLKANKEGENYILNGTKTWITNGPNADVFVVYAKTDMAAGHRGITAFIVER